MKKCCLPLILFCLLSCNTDEPETSRSEFNIDDELKPYVTSFYEEAEARNILLSKNLDATLSTEVDICGLGSPFGVTGTSNRPGSPGIAIKADDACWTNGNYESRERLVFHELGHALLDKLHINEVLENGHTKSIMCGGADPPCGRQPSYLDCPEYREYYLDELFDQNTPPPLWSTRSWNEKADISSELDVLNPEAWQIFTECSAESFSVEIDSVGLDKPADYGLRLSSACSEPITFRRRLDIVDTLTAGAIRLTCDLDHNLQGKEFEMGLFVKNTSGIFTTFNRSFPKDVDKLSNSIDNFSVQAACFQSDSDSLIIDFQFRGDTRGEVLIRNLNIHLME